MSEVKLVVRDAQEDRSGTVHGSLVDYFIAALGADPVSLAELTAAMDRYTLESPSDGYLSLFRRSIDDQPWDAGMVVIDLAARLVASDSTYSSPSRAGFITRHDIDALEGGSIALWYRLADDWLFLSHTLDWRATAEVRRRSRAEQPVRDLRPVFYGEPMLRSIIDGCRRKFCQREEIAKRVHLEWIERRRYWNERYADEPQPDPATLSLHELALRSEASDDLEHRLYYDTLRDIHADWLLTPCAALGGEPPRTVLLQDYNRLSADMDDREYQWSMLDRCPPGLSPESHAFQYGGFNTTEIVMYYDYVRHVAWACWDGLRELTEAQRARLAESPDDLEEFTQAEVIRLLQIGEQWLDAPLEGDCRRTPREMISRERCRLPDGGPFEPLDPDCPCCQALADIPGVGFWHIDGCNMDDLFAFSFRHKTIESWEREQAEERLLDEQLEQQRSLAKQWGLPLEYGEPKAHHGEVWRLNFKDEAGVIPVGVRLNRVAHEVVSLIVPIRLALAEDASLNWQPDCEALSQAYGLLQRACEESTEQQLSLEVEASAMRLLELVQELVGNLEQPVDVGDCENLSVECSDGRLAPASIIGSCRQKVVSSGRQLKRLLSDFTQYQEEWIPNDWSEDDLPF